MIVDALMSWIGDALSWLLSLVPSVPTGDFSGLRSAASSVWTFTSWANQYIPLDHALVILGLVVAGWFVFYGLAFLEWGLTKLHILGGSS